MAEKIDTLTAAIRQQLLAVRDAITINDKELTPISARLVQTHAEVLLGLLNEYVGGSLKPYPPIRREGDA